MTMAQNGRRTALITGASAGIGEAFAHEYARRGWNLVLTARREDRLRALAQELADVRGVAARVLPADLADPAAPAALVDELGRAGVPVDALVNNAGFGVAGSYRSTTWAQQRDGIQVMVTAVAELTHRLLPGMIDRRYGRIVNVASVAGLVPSPPGHTLYGASKSFLVKFSQALAAEVRAYGVHVTALCPGFTFSEFHDVAGTRGQVRQLPSFMWMDAATVARQGVDAVEAGEVIYVNGPVNWTLATLAKYAPDWLTEAVILRNSGKFRKV